MQTTFEHKFNLGDKVCVNSIIYDGVDEGIVTEIQYNVRPLGDEFVSYYVECDGMTELFYESDVIQTKEGLERNEGQSNKIAIK